MPDDLENENATGTSHDRLDFEVFQLRDRMLLQHLKQDEPAVTMTTGLVDEFNNLLTIMLLTIGRLERQPLDENGRRQLAHADAVIMQAARINHQLLWFTRKPDDGLSLVDLNEGVTDLTDLMQQIAGNEIDLNCRQAAQKLMMRVNRKELELALLALVRNAADSLVGGGTIIIRTAGQLSDGLGDQPTVEITVSTQARTGSSQTLHPLLEPDDQRMAQLDRVHHNLWVVQGFAAASGGKLTIEITANRETIMRLVFPSVDDTRE